MGLKLEQVTPEQLNEEFGAPVGGNDPETVKFIASLPIGQGFKVTPDGDETERQVKRRINACAKEAYRELEWKSKEGVKTLTARVKTIDLDAMKKAEEEAKAKADEEAKAKANGQAPESPPANAPQEPAQTRGRQPVAAG